MAAGDTVLTVVGNLTKSPELRFTPDGKAVARFTVASTPRFFDKQAQEWKDGEALFLFCSVWGQQAECVAESLQQGARVIVQGRLRQRSYEKDGERRTVFELEADDVGASLKYAQVRVQKMTRSSANAGSGGGSGNGQGGRGRPSAEDDPWARGEPAF